MPVAILYLKTNSNWSTLCCFRHPLCKVNVETITLSHSPHHHPKYYLTHHKCGKEMIILTFNKAEIWWQINAITIPQAERHINTTNIYLISFVKVLSHLTTRYRGTSATRRKCGYEKAAHIERIQKTSKML